MFSLIGGICKGICDSISQHNNYRNWGNWWSRDYYYNSKVYFLRNNPWWSGKKWRVWFVENVIVMFLDAWHFFQAVDMIADALMWAVPCGVLFGGIPAVFSFGSCFVVFQLFFRVAYK